MFLCTIHLHDQPPPQEVLLCLLFIWAKPQVDHPRGQIHHLLCLTNHKWQVPRPKRRFVLCRQKERLGVTTKWPVILLQRDRRLPLPRLHELLLLPGLASICLDTVLLYRDASRHIRGWSLEDWYHKVRKEWYVNCFIKTASTYWTPFRALISSLLTQKTPKQCNSLLRMTRPFNQENWFVKGAFRPFRSRSRVTKQTDSRRKMKSSCTSPSWCQLNGELLRALSVELLRNVWSVTKVPGWGWSKGKWGARTSWSWRRRWPQCSDVHKLRRGGHKLKKKAWMHVFSYSITCYLIAPVCLQYSADIPFEMRAAPVYDTQDERPQMMSPPVVQSPRRMENKRNPDDDSMRRLIRETADAKAKIRTLHFKPNLSQRVKTARHTLDWRSISLMNYIVLSK